LAYLLFVCQEGFKRRLSLKRTGGYDSGGRRLINHRQRRGADETASTVLHISGGGIMKRVAGETVRLAFAAGVAMALLVSSFACATAPRITKDELRAALGNPEVIVADDRSDGDWTSSEYKINGAIRVAPGEEEAWAARYPKDTMIVFYCS
jgi:hypothetical protein